MRPGDEAWDRVTYKDLKDKAFDFKQTMSYLWAWMMTLAAVFSVSGRILMWMTWGEKSNVIGL